MSQSAQDRLVTVVGGSGFIGRSIVAALAEAGYSVNIICRNPSKANRVKTAGNVGQIVAQYGDLAKPETLEGKLAGSYAVINLVGKLFEKGDQKFAKIHAYGAQWLAQHAADIGVERFVHISALGIDHAKASYARTKREGEEKLLAAFPHATILRPSIVFGADDNFFNQFAQLAKFLPALPAFGGGKSLFQPIYVEDVAQAAVMALEVDYAAGNIYELGGPEVYSFKELLQYTLDASERKRCIASIPTILAKPAAFFAQLLPKPPITVDQLRLLQYDNIVSDEALTIEDLGVFATSIDSIVPHYLSHHRRA